MDIMKVSTPFYHTKSDFFMGKNEQMITFSEFCVVDLAKSGVSQTGLHIFSSGRIYSVPTTLDAQHVYHKT